MVGHPRPIDAYLEWTPSRTLANRLLSIPSVLFTSCDIHAFHPKALIPFHNDDHRPESAGT